MDNDKAKNVATIISAVAGGIVSIIYAYKSLVFWCGPDIFPWKKK